MTTPPAHRFFATALPLAVAALATAGCGSVTLSEPGGVEPPPARRGVPGFDTREYPGDEVMADWLEASPYRWVGFYLPAPCYTGTSWQGKRSRLRDMGWGLAVLFVGEQDWPAGAAAVADSLAAVEPDRCTRDNLSGERGRQDGELAARAAGTEGFAASTVVYLDVERVDSVSERLAAYVGGWTRGVVAGGYAPGLYAHGRNAEALLAVMTDAAGAGPPPRLWVARPGGFSLRRGPQESGFPAAIWQGELDTLETWEGVTLRIDRNVADRQDPSG